MASAQRIKLLGHYLYWAKLPDGSYGWSSPSGTVAEVQRYNQDSVPPLVKTLTGYVAQRWQSAGGDIEWRDRNDQVIALLVP